MYTNNVKVDYSSYEEDIKDVVVAKVKLKFNHPVLCNLAVGCIEHWFARKKIRVTESQINDFVEVFCECINMTVFLSIQDRYTENVWNTTFDKIMVCKLLQPFFIYVDIKMDSSKDELPDVSYRVNVAPIRIWSAGYYTNKQNILLSYFKEDIYKECVTAASCRKVANLADVWDRLAYCEKVDKDLIAKCKYKGGPGFIPVLVDADVIKKLDASFLYSVDVKDVIDLYIMQN